MLDDDCPLEKVLHACKDADWDVHLCIHIHLDEAVLSMGIGSRVGTKSDGVWFFSHRWPCRPRLVMGHIGTLVLLSLTPDATLDPNLFSRSMQAIQTNHQFELLQMVVLQYTIHNIK